MTSTNVSFDPRFAIFLGDETDPGFAKIRYRLVGWRLKYCISQCCSAGSSIDLGSPNLSEAQIATAVTVSGIAAVSSNFFSVAT